MKTVVSVVIPAFNSGRFIGEAIDSVLVQGIAAMEVVVVDDGSTDDTEQVVRRYTGRVRYLQRSHSGPSAARNAGIRASTSEYVAFLDSDDLWPAGTLKARIDLLDTHNDMGLVFGDFEKFDDDGVVMPSMFRQRDLLGDFLGEGPYLQDAFAKLFSCNYIATPTAVVRRAVLTDVGGFDEKLRYVEDMDLWFRIAERYSIGFVPDVAASVRRHGQNTSRDVAAMSRSFLDVLEKLEKTVSRGHLQMVQRRFGVAARDLGYHYLMNGMRAEARAVLLRGLRRHGNLRSLLYYAAALIGPQRSLGWACARGYGRHAPRRRRG